MAKVALLYVRRDNCGAENVGTQWKNWVYELSLQNKVHWPRTEKPFCGH